MSSDDKLIEAMSRAWLAAPIVLNEPWVEGELSESDKQAMREVLAAARAHDRDGARRESALHLAVMSAVGQLNLSAPVATCLFGRGARDTLRQALVDYADAAMRAEG